MRKKLTKSGNSIAMVIPPTYLEVLGVPKEQYKNYDFELSIDGKNQQIIIHDAKYINAEPLSADDLLG